MRFLRVLSLATVLFGFWLLLSGHYTPFLVGSGLVISLVVAMGLFVVGYVDGESYPIGLLPRALLYWPWLAKEIVKSAWGVTRIILDPALPLSPQLIRVKVSQKTSAGVTTYANSLTLTPATITAEVSRGERELLVHALNRAGAEGVQGGEMDRRVTAMEGGR